MVLFLIHHISMSMRWKMMENTVVKYEPHKALFAENKGFAIYELILNDLPKVLNKDAYVTFEIGYNQGERLKILF